MVFTLIILLLIIIFMAFFIGLNIGEVCNIWFFKHFENLPVSVLVLVSFAAGIVVSLVFFMIFKLKKASMQNEAEKIEAQKVKDDKKREKTERKLKKLKEKKGENQSPATQVSSEVTEVTDK